MQERRSNAAAPAAHQHSIELGNIDNVEGEAETAMLVQDPHGSPAKLKVKAKESPCTWHSLYTRYLLAFLEMSLFPLKLVR